MDLHSLPWYAQFLVFLLIGCILFGIFYMFYYSDGQTRLKNLDTQIEKLEDEIKMAEKKESLITRIEEDIVIKEKVLEKLKEILPEEQEISQILRRLQGLISTARLKMTKWGTQSPRQQDFYTEFPFAITVDGSYHNLGSFFDQVSRLKKIFTISNLKISPLSKMTSLYTIKASFTASTYRYMEKVKGKKKKKKPAARQRKAVAGDEELGV